MAFFGKYALTAMGAMMVASTAGAQSAATTTTPALGEWANRISISGEVRFRAERDLDGGYFGGAATQTPGTSQTMGDNLYQRVRARLGVAAKIADNFSVVTRLSTGRNQFTTWATLGQGNVAEQAASGAKSTGFSQRRDFQLDLGYLNYKPVDSVIIQLGKTPVIYWTPGDSQMVWNLGASLEGGQAKWAPEFGSWKPWVAAGYSVALNRVDGTQYSGTGTVGNTAATQGTGSVTDGPPIMMLGAQLGLTWQGESQWATVDAASYSYNNVAGTYAGATGATDQTYGMLGYSPSLDNSRDSFGNYKYDYAMVNVGAEYGMNFNFAPVKVYADYVQNTMVGTDNTGMLVGATVGKLVNKGSWMASATYRDVRRDATMGAYSDIVFLNAGTDVMGAEYQAAYQIWEKAGIAALYDNGKKILSNNGGSVYEIYMFDVYAYF